jgi:hypothetical protein
MTKNSSKKSFAALVGATLLLASTLAAATPVVVSAYDNDLPDGTAALSGITLTTGQHFTVSAALDDTWNFGNGEPQYESNADGISWLLDIGNPDGSSLQAHFGSLLGQIGGGNYFVVGTAFDGVANASGELKFFYVDSDRDGNIGSVTADVNVTALPEPASMMLTGVALAGLGLARRRKA